MTQFALAQANQSLVWDELDSLRTLAQLLTSK